MGALAGHSAESDHRQRGLPRQQAEAHGAERRASRMRAGREHRRKQRRIRAEGGTYVFPVDMNERLDVREKQILARMERLRDLDAESRKG